MKSILMFFLLFVSSFTLRSQDFDQIKGDLEKLFNENIKLRSNVMPTIQSYGMESPQMDSLNKEILQFDSTALILVEDILKKHGWLGSSQIGQLANQSIYLTIQHAQDHEIRVKYFPLLKVSAEKGESDISDMATMQDRILVDSGLPQMYGTQSRMVNNELEYYPVEDPKNVNKRRKAVGLGKISIKK